MVGRWADIQRQTTPTLETKPGRLDRRTKTRTPSPTKEGLAEKESKMSIDTANRIINEQEDAIAELKHNLLSMEDSRDLAVGRSLEMVQALKRIECSEDLEACRTIAMQAISDFQGK